VGRDQRIPASAIARELAACTPASETAAAVLDWVVRDLDLTRNLYPRDLAIARETARILGHPLLADGLSLKDLDEAASEARPGRRSAAATAAARIRHVLQARGHVPPPREVSASRRLTRLIESAPPDARGRLETWAQRRGRLRTAEGLTHEIGLLIGLERFRQGRERLDDLALATAWIDAYTRIVPACACPPVCKSPLGCRCGATVEKTGPAPQPRPAKRREYRQIALHYLRHVHEEGGLC
jgi:hypothetical protein